MTVRWTAGRLVFEPAQQRPWMASHGCTPTAIVLRDRFRLLFAPRDAAGRSIPSYVDVAIDDPARVLAVGDAPIMALGELGTFDDGGIMPCSVVEGDNGRLWLYYVGWNASVSVPYRNAIGVAVSEDEGRTFQRLFPGAVVDRSPTEPFFTASPYVMRTNGEWHMWYASTIRFETHAGRAEPVYVIRHATSQNGVDWIREGGNVLEQRHLSEAQARPCVLSRPDGGWEMWFCHRDNADFRDGDGSYRLGLARSDDNRTWIRIDDDAGPGRGAADRTMQAYPNVVRQGDRLHMFYNGNGFGRAGILHATSVPTGADG